MFNNFNTMMDFLSNKMTRLVIVWVTMMVVTLICATHFVKECGCTQKTNIQPAKTVVAEALTGADLTLPTGWQLSKSFINGPVTSYQISTDAPSERIYQPTAFAVVYDAEKWTQTEAKDKFAMTTTDKKKLLTAMTSIAKDGNLSADNEKTLQLLKGDLMGTDAGNHFAMLYTASKNGQWKGVRFYSVNDEPDKLSPIYYTNLYNAKLGLIISFGYRLDGFKDIITINQQVADRKITASNARKEFVKLLDKSRSGLSWGVAVSKLDKVVASFKKA